MCTNNAHGKENGRTHACLFVARVSLRVSMMRVRVFVCVSACNIGVGDKFSRALARRLATQSNDKAADQYQVIASLAFAPPRSIPVDEVLVHTYVNALSNPPTMPLSLLSLPFCTYQVLIACTQIQSGVQMASLLLALPVCVYRVRSQPLIALC